LVDGEKGGVGKSLVSRVMIEYFREKGVPFSAIDADRTNPDVSEIYSDVCKTAYFSDNERQSRELDRVLDWALEKSVIINLPGQVQTLVKQWLERNELLELAAENNITFVKWFVTNGGYGSVKLFTDSVELYKGKLIHVFVRNEGVCPEWDHLAANSNLTGVLLLPHVKAINFPKFYYLERDTVDELKLIAVAKAIRTKQNTETKTSQSFPFCLLPSALCLWLYLQCCPSTSEFWHGSTSPHKQVFIGCLCCYRADGTLWYQGTFKRP
jgi:hypothetical protein